MNLFVNGDITGADGAGVAGRGEFPVAFFGVARPLSGDDFLGVDSELRGREAPRAPRPLVAEALRLVGILPTVRVGSTAISFSPRSWGRSPLSGYSDASSGMYGAPQPAYWITACKNQQLLLIDENHIPRYHPRLNLGT